MGRVTGAMLPFGYAYASLIWPPLPRPHDRLGDVSGDCQSFFASPHRRGKLPAPNGLFY